jgi:hypothetical protein
MEAKGMGVTRGGHPPHERGTSARKPYSPPVLSVHGKLTEITRTSSLPGGFDGLFGSSDAS